MNPKIILTLVVVGLTAVSSFVYYLYIQARLEKDDTHD